MKTLVECLYREAIWQKHQNHSLGLKIDVSRALVLKNFMKILSMKEDQRHHQSDWNVFIEFVDKNDMIKIDIFCQIKMILKVCIDSKSQASKEREQASKLGLCCLIEVRLFRTCYITCCKQFSKYDLKNESMPSKPNSVALHRKTQQSW